MRLLSTSIDILETVEQLSTESETTSTKSEWRSCTKEHKLSKKIVR